MLHWGKRIRHWAGVMSTYHGKVPWRNLILAALSGPVPAQVWNERIRKCARCPVRSEDDWICHNELGDGRTVGCGCDLVFKALSAAPYPKGCWAYQVTDGHEGWPAHRFPSRWARWLAVVRFLFP